MALGGYRLTLLAGRFRCRLLLDRPWGGQELDVPDDRVVVAFLATEKGGGKLTGSCTL